MKKTLAIFTCLLISILSFAQDTAIATEESTGMRANEKIYVVVAVLATVLAGFFIYLVRLDKKIGRLERDDRRSADGKK